LPIVADSTADWLHEKELRQLSEKSISQFPEKCRIVPPARGKKTLNLIALLAPERGVFDSHVKKFCTIKRRPVRLSDKIRGF
jgi:hypothetical protein